MKQKNSAMQKSIRIFSLLTLAAVQMIAYTNCGQMQPLSSGSQATSSVGEGNGDEDPASNGEPTSPAPPPSPALAKSSTLLTNSNSNGNLCIENMSGLASGSNCETDNKNQIFQLTSRADGAVSLKLEDKSLCLEIDASDLSQSQGVSIKPCAETPNQNFTLSFVKAASFRLVSQANGACLQLESAAKKVSMARCSLASSQTFSFNSSAVSSFTYHSSLQAPLPVAPGAALPKFYKGIHLGGAESGNLSDQNRYGYNYAYPSNSLIDYVARKGFSLIRLSFKLGRLQPTLNGPLDQTELARIDKVVQYAHAKGLYVLLDPHDYGSMRDANTMSQKIGSSGLPAKYFANFWARVASVYINQPNIIYGLMNEPYGINPRQWQSSAISALSAIRSVGAKQLIFVPGVSWTGAHSWISSGNAAVWANFKDANFSFEIHQYFDSDSSGTNEICSTNVGVNRFKGFTAWAEANGQRGFLGEVGWGDNANCAIEAEAAFSHMDEHPAAYLGWSYFGAGWYNGFMTLNPVDLGKTSEVDKPQTTLIRKHL